MMRTFQNSRGMPGNAKPHDIHAINAIAEIIIAARSGRWR